VIDTVFFRVSPSILLFFSDLIPLFLGNKQLLFPFSLDGAGPRLPAVLLPFYLSPFGVFTIFLNEPLLATLDHLMSYF